MNILDYIDDLIEQGYSEEDAEICADCMFFDHLEGDDDCFDPETETPEDYFGE